MPDATAENHCVDDLRQSASWFDFGTRHRADIPEIHRHADDLRALVFSSAVHMAADQYDQLAQVVISSTRRCCWASTDEPKRIMLVRVADGQYHW